jgi:limonene-1,2-epoxide hydrolase
MSQARYHGGEQIMATELTGPVAQYIAAINAFDTDAAVATFADDAYVNDARREINGIDAIRQWVTKEMVGDHVTMEVREVVDHHGETIVRSRYDGTYDKTNLPDELVMSDYFRVQDGKIISLTSSSTSPPRTKPKHGRHWVRAFNCP